MVYLSIDAATKIAPYRVGKWLPSDQRVLDKWLAALIQEVDQVEVAQAYGFAHLRLHPAVQKLKDLIEEDAEVYMLFSKMFDEVPNKPPYNLSPIGKPQVKDYTQMLRLISTVMTRAPECSEAGLVGFPINAILDWSMGTASGHAAFLNPKVNSVFKEILNEWGLFLTTKDSLSALHTGSNGWLGEIAMKKMPNFVEEYKCDPRKPHHGFSSWDEFFTREFREGVRPIASPRDDSVILNACESAPYKLQRNAKLLDSFWIKSHKYALKFMLANDHLAPKFDGGVVYQAFLSPFSYHRWHSPVSGTVIRAYVKDGTYYSEALSQGFDPEGPNQSQGYITEVATRAMIFIESDNPYIGLVCFLAVGMAEVSTCEIKVEEGQYITKGDELGTFHFGGSTYCLIFRPGVELTFDLHGQRPGLDAADIPVNSRIATVPRTTH